MWISLTLCFFNDKRNLVTKFQQVTDTKNQQGVRVITSRAYFDVDSLCIAVPDNRILHVL